MMDKLMAGLGLLILAGFAGTLIVNVPEIDLSIILVAVVAMCAYDFWQDTRGSTGTEPDDKSKPSDLGGAG